MSNRSLSNRKPGTPMKKYNMERALLRIQSELQALIAACPESANIYDERIAENNVIIVVRHIKQLWSQE